MFGKKNNDYEYRIARLEKTCKELSEKCEASGHLIATLQQAMQTKDLQISELQDETKNLRKLLATKKNDKEPIKRLDYDFGPKHTLHTNEDYGG